LQTSRLK